MSNINSTQLVVEPIKRWIQNIIIEHNICPFAKRVFDQDSIHYDVIDSANLEEQLQALIANCVLLDKDPEIETSLIIYPNGLDDFDIYLDFLAIANALLEKQGYEGTYQLASFHPDYCFEGVDEDDACNYTNRAPYPTLHLIREASLETALKNYPDPEKIPQRNIEYTRQLGQKKMKKMLGACLRIGVVARES